MPCCLFYCHLASQLDPKPFKQVFAYQKAKTCLKKNSSHCELGPPVVSQASWES